MGDDGEVGAGLSSSLSPPSPCSPWPCRRPALTPRRRLTSWSLCIEGTDCDAGHGGNSAEYGHNFISECFAELPHTNSKGIEMLRILLAAALFCLISSGSNACLVGKSTDLRLVFSADAVVTGRVVAIDSQINKAKSKYYSFNVVVSKNIFGNTSSSITVRWRGNWENRRNEIQVNQEYTIALMRDNSSTLQKSTASASTVSNIKPDTWRVLHAPCSGPFIFDRGEAVARAIWIIFDGEGDAKIEADAFAKFLGMTGGDF